MQRANSRIVQHWIQNCQTLVLFMAVSSIKWKASNHVTCQWPDMLHIKNEVYYVRIYGLKVLPRNYLKKKKGKMFQLKIYFFFHASLGSKSVLAHYSPVLLFYTPLKQVRFSDVFRGYRKATLGCNGLTNKTSVLACECEEICIQSKH